MKIFDVILILIILGLGASYHFNKNGPGNCYKGQLQLTNDVRAFIDGEFAKAGARGMTIQGLKELTDKLGIAEQKFTELLATRKKNSELFISTTTSIRQVWARKKALQNDIEKTVESLKKQSQDTCLKGVRPKL